MAFSIILTPPTPAEAVLCAEQEISGLEFIALAQGSLKSVVPSTMRQVHHTLGRRTTYTIELPDEVAIASGLFHEANSIYVVCPNDGLKNFIFYTAEKTLNANSNRNYSMLYPYARSSVTLKSHIDEFALIEVWANHNYPTNMEGILEGTDTVPTPPTNGNTGTEENTGCGCKFCF